MNSSSSATSAKRPGSSLGIQGARKGFGLPVELEPRAPLLSPAREALDCLLCHFTASANSPASASAAA